MTQQQLKSQAGPRCKRVMMGNARRMLDNNERFPDSQTKGVLKESETDANSEKTKRVPYTVIEFWTDLKTIWNFVFECFCEKVYRQENILRKRKLWIKKCNDIMEQWKREISKRKSSTIGKNSTSITPEKSKNKKGKQGLVTRQYLLRPGYDYTLEVHPIANKNNPFHSMEKSRDHQGSKETSEFRCLPPAHGQIKDLPQTTRIWKQKKMKMFEGNRHVGELWCSLCLATGGQLARCRGCRRVR